MSVSHAITQSGTERRPLPLDLSAAELRMLAVQYHQMAETATTAQIRDLLMKLAERSEASAVWLESGAQSSRGIAEPGGVLRPDRRRGIPGDATPGWPQACQAPHSQSHISASENANDSPPSQTLRNICQMVRWWCLGRAVTKRMFSVQTGPLG